MRFIDKNIRKPEGISLMERFLQDCFNEDEGRFIPAVDCDLLYDRFRDKAYRCGSGGWESILLEQQDCRCCYCMRRLTPRNPDKAASFNIEHIVPRNIPENPDKQTEFGRYCTVSDVIEGNVEYDGDFAKRKINAKADVGGFRRFPHRIALANLIASCNGKRGSMLPENVLKQQRNKHDKVIPPGCCINNSRQTDFLNPLMLHADRADKVYYTCDEGIMIIPAFSGDPTWNDIVNQLNDETLKEIRHLWYLIHLHAPGFDAAAGVAMPMLDRMGLMKSLFGTDDFNDVEERYRKYTGFMIGTDFYWNLLMDYDWFLTYDWDRRPTA